MARIRHFKLTDSQKNLLREGLLAAVIFCLLLAIAFGWFSSNKEVSAGGVQLAAQMNDITATLYKLKENASAPPLDEDWTKVDHIQIENYLPGESHTYKIVLTNQSQTAGHTCSVTLANFGYTLNLNNDPTENNNFNDPSDPANYNGLENVIELTELNLSGAKSKSFAAAGPNVLSYYWKDTPENRNLILAQGIEINKKQEGQAEGANTATIQFTFRLKEDAENAYQNQILKFDKIEIATSK